MTNFEYYRDEMLGILTSGYEPALIDGELVRCKGNCKECKFCTPGRSMDDCCIDVMLWLYAEHTPRPVITKHMRAFCEVVQYGYLAKDRDGSTWWSNAAPKKNVENGAWETAFDSPNRIAFMAPEDCKFIQWEDKEPWAVKEILTLEVES